MRFYFAIRHIFISYFKNDLIVRYFRFLCLCIGFILLACKQNETKIGTSVKLINNEPINIELSDIVDNIAYVKLETRDECMLCDRNGYGWL